MFIKKYTFLLSYSYIAVHLQGDQILQSHWQNDFGSHLHDQHHANERFYGNTIVLKAKVPPVQVLRAAFDSLSRYIFLPLELYSLHTTLLLKSVFN